MELKPCPFCGNPEVTLYGKYTEPEDKLTVMNLYWFVECEGCECQGPASFDKEAAIQKWNCRSTEDWNKVQSEVEIKLGQKNED